MIKRFCDICGDEAISNLNCSFTISALDKSNVTLAANFTISTSSERLHEPDMCKRCRDNMVYELAESVKRNNL